MKKELTQPLRKGFAHRLQQQFPMFSDVTRACVVPSGMKVHQYDFHPDLCFFITLWPSPKSWDYRFTFTVAAIDKSFEELQQEQERQFPEQLAAVEPQLDDVFRRLREHAVPYFNRVAADFGYSDPPFPEPDPS